MITAVVGAGGKTTLIHELAERFRQQGKKVFVTTTTHMYIEPDTLLTDDHREILAQMTRIGYAMAGIPAGEKIGPLSEETYAAVCAEADEVLVEADGANHMAVKFPKTHEPVLPRNTEKIIVVCGLHGLGKTVREAAFRREEVMQCLGICEETALTPRHLQELIQKGYVIPLTQQFPNAEIRVHAAGGTTLYERAVGALLEAGMDTGLIREEWFSPKPTLFICGAGHVAAELAEFAARLDFRVHILDERPEFANRERLPFVREVICDSYQNLEKYLVPDAFYAVITPGHENDFACVKAILGSQYRYLGMIGSRAKVARTFDSLRAAGFTQAQIDTVHAPIGLAIGAETPAEIAVSILAQIIQTKNSRSAASVSAELLESKKHGMLCIIIEKKGSAPRGTGSMMLVTQEEVLDTIGGGSVEYTAIQDARNSPQAAIRRYNLNSSDVRNLGMVCGGSNTVLFLPV